MTSPLYPTFEKRINDAARVIVEKNVTPWAFLKAGPKFSVKTFNGKEISYQGIAFEGAPRTVFWGGYIDPFLEALAVEEIGHAVSLATERKVDLRILLPEVEGLLLSASNKIFYEMAKIDRNLRGNGYPANVNLRSTKAEFDRISEFISIRVKSELLMWKPKRFYEEWYEKNKFLTWVVGIFVALLGATLTAMKLLAGI